MSSEAIFELTLPEGWQSQPSKPATLAGPFGSLQQSEHLLAMGQVVADRAEYVSAVRRLRDLPAPLSAEPQSVLRLA